jgi:fatty acid/phospholipid biosynthesis enzyme
MKFDRRKIFVKGSKNVIQKTDEVSAALKKKKPTDIVLIKLLVSNDQADVEAADKEIRQLAYGELLKRGYFVEA